VGDGCWFRDNIGRKVWNDESTLFWKDEWVDGVSL
jgi:hypothetical protein